MVREFCDRCKAEIPNERGEKHSLKIVYRTGKFYSYGEILDEAEISLCKKCFSEMDIDAVINKVGDGKRTEKEPSAVEKLMDIFRELINECME